MYMTIKNKSFWLLLAMLLVLVACEPVTPTAAPTTEEKEVEESQEASPTSVDEKSPAANEAQAPQPSSTVQAGAGGMKSPCRTADSIIPPVKEDEQIKGDKNATVTIVEYSDFMCPYCAMVAPALSQIAKLDGVRLVFRHFPLSTIHDKALLAAQAAEAAGLQGKFWEMHDILFEKQQDWSGLPLDRFELWLDSKVDSLKLDKEKFKQDLKSDSIVKKVQQAFDDAAALGIPGTPTIFINGLFYAGAPSLESLNAYIKKVQEVKQYSCPPQVIDPKKQYKAIIQTDKGDITIQLFADKAPVTVNSFVFLAKEGWFDGITFHRVIHGFVAQSGDPFGSGAGGPGYQFINEIVPGLTFGEAGVVGMANAGPDTNGSQFFITYGGIPEETVKHLDGNYTIFGKVIAGMDVVEKLTERDPAKDPNPPQGDVIKSIRIEEN